MPVTASTGVALRARDAVPSVFTPIPVRGKKKKAGNQKVTAKVDANVAQLLDLEGYEKSMKSTVDAMQANLARIRSGLPSPTLLDGKCNAQLQKGEAFFLVSEYKAKIYI